MINKTGQAAKNILNGHSNIIMVIKGILVSYLFTIPMFAILRIFLNLRIFRSNTCQLPS